MKEANFRNQFLTLTTELESERQRPMVVNNRLKLGKLVEPPTLSSRETAGILSTNSNKRGARNLSMLTNYNIQD